MAIEGHARGDFLVARADGHTDVVCPDGYASVIRVGDTDLAVRPGWGLSHVTGPNGVVVLCGFTVQSRDDVVRNAAEVLLARGEPLDREVNAFFKGVVGHFAAAVASRSSVRLVTDHLATISVYVETGPDPKFGGTNLSDLSRLVTVEPDIASVEEFLATGRIVAPHTVYQSIRRMWPATVTELQPQVEAEPYWRPPVPARRDASTAAREYRDLLEQTMAELGRRSPTVSIMFSGGEDSRAVGAVARQAGLDVRGAIFLDQHNREFRHARMSARMLGIPLSVRHRSPDHDAAELDHQVDINGPGIDLLHAHARGLIDADSDPMPVLDGWFAALLKADYAPTTGPQWRGFAVGLTHLRSDDLERGRHRLDPDSPAEAEVASRWAAKARRLDHLPDLSRQEWMAQYPASDQTTYPFFAFNQRRFPNLSPFLLLPLVDLVSGVDLELRLNRRFFKQAFGRSIGAAAFVPRTEGEVLGLSPRLDLVATAFNQAQYRVHKAVSQRRGRQAPQGPWQSRALRSRAARSALAASDPNSLAMLRDLSATARKTMDALDAGNAPASTVVHRTAQLARAFTAQDAASPLR
jgi:hypothetical protein